MSSNWRTERRARTCRTCGIEFEGAYNSTACKECRAATKRRATDAFRDRNPNYWREWSAVNQNRHTRIKQQYGLTEAQWYAMRDAQGGGCAICGRAEGWKANAGMLVVDHCHSTGRVRGLLCPSCNRGLGQFEDEPARLIAAAAYVEAHLTITM